MSLSLLLEKYDVSSEEGLQKALNDIEKEEADVDDALAGVLSRASILEGRLRTASQAYNKLGEVKNDALEADTMVEKTAALARDVSAKVRQLDLARSRVAECQRRVHDLIDLQLCSAGVEAAIKAHDYETGAAHVARFLSMDPRSLHAAQARGAPDPRAAMARAADTLREHLVRKFEEAARKEDETSVERLLKLFPQIGCVDEGVILLAKYIASQTEARISRQASSAGGVTRLAVSVAMAAEGGGAAVVRLRALCPGHLAAAMRHVQPVVCAYVRRSWMSAREGARVPVVAGAEALDVEPTAGELSETHATLQLYFSFLRRNTQVDAAALDDTGQKAASDAIEKVIAESDLMKTTEDILMHYLALEKFFLEESVNKALKLSAPQPGTTTSSLVDDVFYIARKVIRRSLSSGSVEGACCVLNECAAMLEHTVARELRRRLRPPTADPPPLPLPTPPTSRAADPLPLAARLNRDLDAQNALFLALMNEAEAGAEWSERLATDSVREAEHLVSTGDKQRDKLTTCAAQLAAAAAAFRAAHEYALNHARAALRPRAHAWADLLADPAPDDTESAEDADALPAALEVLSEAARVELGPRGAELLLLAVLHDICARAETAMLRNVYTRESGAVVERRARRLSMWAGGGAGGARERCARVVQCGALLAAAEPNDAPLVLRAAPRLAPHEARALLARRTDFKMEDIKRLKF